MIIAIAALIPLAFLFGGRQPGPAEPGGDPSHATSCQDLIAQAMEASGRSCDRTGSNQACYGNTIVRAELIPDTIQRFSQRGDIVDVDRIVRLSAAPLDLSRQVWGVAVLRIVANLPRSLPGETVTMIVFGNTTLGSQASNLQSFYFFSEVGQIACAQVPYDGIMITMPDGAGVSLRVNGAELTLMGKASLSATRNGQMDLNLYEGSAQIAANGQEQSVSPGEQVSVDLGGADGTDAIGPPSAPEPLSPEDNEISCTISGLNCPPTETPSGSAGTQATPDDTLESASTLSSTPAQAGATATVQTPSGTATALSTPTHTPTASRTPTHNSTPAATDTSSGHISTSTRTPTSTATKIPSATLMPTIAPSATSTFTKIPSIAYTATDLPTKTPSPVPTDLPTKVPSLVPTDLPTKTASPVPTASPSKGPVPISPSPTSTGLSPAPATTAAPASTAINTSVAPAGQPDITAVPAPTSLPLDSFVAFGQEGIFLEQNAIIHSGSVGANSSTSGPYLNGSQEVVIGTGVRVVLPASQVMGDSVLIRQNAHVFDVLYNDLTENGTVNGSLYTPLGLPLVASLPAVPSFSPGSQNVSLASGASTTLDAGNYGQLTTKAMSTITFTGGIYNFTAWSIGQNSNLYFLAPTEIRIAGQLDTASGTFLGPADGSGLSATDILIVVGGINGSSGAVGATPKALQIGPSNTLVANLYAPNGTLLLQQNTVATGAFLARWVDIGPSVDLTLESTFH